MTDGLLIYGSYGYTGSLVANAAVEAGMSPILAGRDAEAVERQATDLGLDHRVFSLEHPAVIDDRVGDVSVVLNCAGPFAATAAPLSSACLRSGTDYLDIAGEIDVLEAAAERDRDAEKAGVVLLPAVGFDVVPTDCLASHLESRLRSATRLTIALDGLGTFSAGTVKSIVDELSRSGAVRQDGEIRTVPAAWKSRRFDFGDGPKVGVTVPWGDVATAYYTTGIGNVETYATVPRYAVGAMRRLRPLAAVLGSDPVRWALKELAEAAVSGPTATQRARSTTRVWGEVRDDDGGRAVARLRTPDTYDVTAQTAVEAARRTLDGEVSPGFQTPASAFGADFVTEFEGVELVDVTAEPAVPASAEQSGAE
ncbi:MAG: trans-acting enoyl reductase family protein [Salinigranum sp.]